MFTVGELTVPDPDFDSLRLDNQHLKFKVVSSLKFRHCHIKVEKQCFSCPSRKASTSKVLATVFLEERKTIEQEGHRRCLQEEYASISLASVLSPGTDFFFSLSKFKAILYFVRWG